jgi:hypothetical protein
MGSTQVFPLDPAAGHRRPSGRFHKSLEDLINVPVHNNGHMGSDTAWALKLKMCVESVARELHIDVLAAKPIRSFESHDSRDMLFEVVTNRGCLEVVRKRTGEHQFNWK